MSNDGFNVIATGASYEAARQGRRMAGWRTSASGPQRTVADSVEMLRRRTRDAVRNNPHAASIINAMVRNLVGYGIATRFSTSDTATKDKLTKLFAAWAQVADADGGDLVSLQQTAVRTWLEAGEVFVRVRPRRIADGLPVAVQLQLMEPECVPLLDADTYAGMPAGNYIRQGIEFDGIGRRTAYWFWKSHPQDTTPPNINAGDLSRVPAEQVFHLFEPLRPGQLRGVPVLAPVLSKMRNLDDFDDAVLERQKLANLFVTFITRPLPSGANDPMTGLPAEGSPAEPVAALEPGISQELLPGEDVKFSEPPDAGANYADFIRSQLHSVAAGTGLPYELLTGDLKDVSDRTLRVSVNEFRRHVESKVWGVIVPRLLRPLLNQWAIFAMVGGPLSSEEAAQALLVEFAPPAFSPLHPTQDIQARKLEVDAGFRSRASVISEMGYDPAAVDAERAADKQRADGLGLQTADEQLAAAEVAKLEAEAAAAEKAATAAQEQARTARARASEAQASADTLKAQRRTVEATRQHEVDAAADRARVARLELKVAEVGVAELTGGKKRL